MASHGIAITFIAGVTSSQAPMGPVVFGPVVPASAPPPAPDPSPPERDMSEQVANGNIKSTGKSVSVEEVIDLIEEALTPPQPQSASHTRSCTDDSPESPETPRSSDLSETP